MKRYSTSGIFVSVLLVFSIFTLLSISGVNAEEEISVNAKSYENTIIVEFEKEEVCRYISGKIALGSASFLTEKTRDRLRTLYRLISERIRQYQNTTPLEQFSNE